MDDRQDRATDAAFGALGGDPGRGLASGGIDHRLGAGQAGQCIDQGGREDRQPGPGHQRRTEVVAADVGIDVRGGEEAGDRRGRPGQSA